MSAPESRAPYTIAGDVLTRLTLDVRAAIQAAHDSDSRVYAFAISHLARDLAAVLTQAVWTSPDEAGTAALGLLAARVRRDPENVPDWLHVVARSWP